MAPTVSLSDVFPALTPEARERIPFARQYLLPASTSERSSVTLLAVVRTTAVLVSFGFLIWDVVENKKYQDPLKYDADFALWIFNPLNWILLTVFTMNLALVVCAMRVPKGDVTVPHRLSFVHVYIIYCEMLLPPFMFAYFWLHVTHALAPQEAHVQPSVETTVIVFFFLVLIEVMARATPAEFTDPIVSTIVFVFVYVWVLLFAQLGKTVLIPQWFTNPHQQGASNTNPDPLAGFVSWIAVFGNHVALVLGDRLKAKIHKIPKYTLVKQDLSTDIPVGEFGLRMGMGAAARPPVEIDMGGV